MNITITGEVFEWRGPAPFYFVRVPQEECALIKSIASQVTYGWGVVPTYATIGETRWKTSLMPKDGQYLVPMKDAIRNTEGIEEGDTVEIELEI